MKTIKKLTAVFLAVLMIISLASCSLVDESDTDITNDTIKIGVLLSGTRDDTFGNTGICNTAVKGVSGLGYGISAERFKYAENTNPADADSVNRGLTSLLNNECNIIVASDPAYAPAVEKIASGYENITFLTFKGTSNGKNVFAYNANITGAAFLSGVAAGSKCAELKVAKVGFEAATDKDLTVANAFFAGVKSVAPAATAAVTTGFDVKENTRKLINAGCVVIASDFSSGDLAKECTDNKIPFCGFGTADYGDYEDFFICAPVYNFTQYFINTIKAVVDGTAVSEYKGSMKLGSTYVSEINSKIFISDVSAAKIAVSTKMNEIYNGMLKTEFSASQLSEGMEMAK